MTFSLMGAPAGALGKMGGAPVSCEGGLEKEKGIQPSGRSTRASSRTILSLLHPCMHALCTPCPRSQQWAPSFPLQAFADAVRPGFRPLSCSADSC